MYLLLVLATGATTLGAAVLAYWRYRDSFHPLVYLSPMLCCLYSLVPLYLNHSGELYDFLTQSEAVFVQLINLLGIVALIFGVIRGAKGRRSRVDTGLASLTPLARRRIQHAAVFVGMVGVVGFFVMLWNVGGIEEAYGLPYGGGWSDFGYTRESILWMLPALLWLMMVYQGRRPSRIAWVLISLFSMPLLAHGLLGARRGPIFMIVVTLVLGWYLMRQKRPALRTVLFGGAGLGLFLLFLVANRSEIYLGSELSFEHSPLEYVQAGTGNEYIYGAGTILNNIASDQYFWGRRYLIVFLVRPIPRAIWPTKYEDASDLLRIPSIEQNLGLGTGEFEFTLGWTGALGAAPGIVADMWAEFWWFGLVALFAIGWVYGCVWRRAVTVGGHWIPLYALMAALSLYLVMQTLEAMAFRLLLTAIPVWLIWCYGTYSMRIVRLGRLTPWQLFRTTP